MTTRHRITTRRSSVAAGALVLLLAIAVTACGSDTKADDTDTVERSAATYRGTRACFTNNTSESIGIAAFEWGASSWRGDQPESLDPISLGGTSWCRQVDGGNLNGGSLGLRVYLGQDSNVTIALVNTYRQTSGSTGEETGSCRPTTNAVESGEPGSFVEAVCGGTKITITFMRTSTYFQEWDVKFSRN